MYVQVYNQHMYNGWPIKDWTLNSIHNGNEMSGLIMINYKILSRIEIMI